MGRGKKIKGVFSPLVLLRGTEGAGKSGAEGLTFRAVEAVRNGRSRGEGFSASAGAWGLWRTLKVTTKSINHFHFS